MWPLAPWLCLLLMPASPARLTFLESNLGHSPATLTGASGGPITPVLSLGTFHPVQRAMITVPSKSGIKARHLEPVLSHCADFMSCQERFWARIGGAGRGPALSLFLWSGQPVKAEEKVLSAPSARPPSLPMQFLTPSGPTVALPVRSWRGLCLQENEQKLGGPIGLASGSPWSFWKL